MKFNDLTIDGYERVIEVTDDASALHAIIALHNTTLGPALGGIRAYNYSSFDAALNDALRLAKGMTYKSAVSEVGTGGGKSVIISKGAPNKEQLLAFGRAVQSLEGGYICAEDLGITQKDLSVIFKETPYIVGIPESSGNPSPFTAWGGFRGIEAVCKHLWDTPSVAGRTVAIQGLGQAGIRLAHFLFWSGARLIVADVDESRCAHAAQAFGAKVVSVDEILSVECDIVAPCALGGILDESSISQLKCKAVAGLANNQLLTPEDGDRLVERGILYSPDYVINSGGLMNVCVEITPEGYDANVARAHVDRVYDLLLTIFTQAKSSGLSTSVTANKLAELNLEKKIGKRTCAPHFHQ